MAGKQKNIHGSVAKGFELVRDEFEKNFSERKELGASCAVYYKGKKVVDLWGGTSQNGSEWQEDTMVLIFSATKGVASMVLAKLHSEGLLDYEAAITEYWPEFGQNHKEDITVKQLLSHQAGLVLLDEKIKISHLNDFDQTATILSRAKPLWKPGKYQGYQAGTVGLYMGELVRRIDKKHRTLGEYFEEEIRKPMNLEFYIGLPDKISAERVADIKMINPVFALFNLGKMPSGMRKVMLNPTSSFFRSVGLIKGYKPNSRETWRIEQPSGNGIGTARSVAFLYSMMAGNDEFLNLSEDTLKILRALPERPVGGYFDQVINMETRYGAGFMKPDPVFNFSNNKRAFGFLGATGSFAFADHEKEMGYSYLTRKMGYFGLNDPREQSVREAVYECIKKIEKNNET